MSHRYKDTLNLPKTPFPMRGNLPHREREILSEWEKSALYQSIQAERKGAPVYLLHDGPPYTSGELHLGTALNKILKDIVIRYRTMAGFRVPFVPGWDCHGLPVEYKVIKNASDIPASEVRKRCRAFANDYKKRMERQFRRLGVMGDWESSYSTMDPSYEAEQLRAFAAMVDRNLIFQARKPVHWSVGAQTALAEFEIEYREIESPAIYVLFELRNGAGYGSCDIVIWTTTPWTLPANQAVAVDPEAEYGVWRFRRQKESAERRLVMAADRIGAFCAATGYRVVGGVRNPVERFKGSELSGQVVKHPLLDRLVPILPADFVTMGCRVGRGPHCTRTRRGRLSSWV